MVVDNTEALFESETRIIVQSSILTVDQINKSNKSNIGPFFWVNIGQWQCQMLYQVPSYINHLTFRPCNARNSM